MLQTYEYENIAFKIFGVKLQSQRTGGGKEKPKLLKLTLPPLGVTVT